MTRSTGLAADVAGGALHLVVVDSQVFRAAAAEYGAPEWGIESMIRGIEVDAAANRDLVDDMIDELQGVCGSVLEDFAVPFRETPVVACAVEYLNAGAAPAPAGGDVIVLNVGVFHGSWWVLALHHVTGLQRGLGERERLEIQLELPALAALVMEAPTALARHPELLSSFHRVMTIFGGQPTHDATGATGFPVLFTLLHEYGHVVLGHTDEIRQWPSMSEILEEPRLDLLARCRQMELDADAFAAERIGRLKHDDVAVQVGIIAFFALLHLHSRMAFTQTPPELLTHPPALERYETAVRHVAPGTDPSSWTSRFFGMIRGLDRIPRPASLSA